MDTGGRQDGLEQEQRAVAGSIAADEVNSVHHGSERMDLLEVGFDEDVSVELLCQ